VIRRDHRVELALHRAHEHGVRGKGPRDPGLAGGRREHIFVFHAKPAAVTAVGIQRAQRDARVADAEPLGQAMARDLRRPLDALRRYGRRNVAQREVCRREHHAQRVLAARDLSGRSEHHRYVAGRQRAEHLRVPGIVESAGEQRGLVYRSGDDSLDVTRQRQGYGALDRASAERPRELGRSVAPPFPYGLVRAEPHACGRHHQNVTALDDTRVIERSSYYLGADSSRITRGDSQPRAHLQSQ